MSTPTNETPPTSPGVNGLPADLQDERLIASRGLGGWASVMVARMRTGDLGSLPVVIGLVVIWAVFASLDPLFLSSANLVNLTLQSAATGTIALGIVLVLLLGEIDLSVGSVSGVSAAILAVVYIHQEWPWYLAAAAALASGLVVGLIYGAMFIRFGVPSFVITLAGLLAFMGLQLFILGDAGSIAFPYDSALVDFAQQTFLPAAVAYVLVAVVVALYVLSRNATSRQRSAAGLSSTPLVLQAARAAVLAVLMLIAVYVLNQDRGVSVMFLVFLVLVVIVDLAVRRTGWGRSIMAVGGNVEAARRAGINVKRVYLSVFAVCSTLAALGGIFAAARLAAANQSTGAVDVNLNAIAAAVIGGTSLFGGRGSAYSALLGILVIQSITNGLGLLNLDSPVQYMVTGGVLLLAVIIDSLSRRSRSAHGRA
ncbi:MAG: ABC transporter permease [Nakamurella sp.]